MRVLYYDCFTGISGDMNLAALIDLGVDPQYLRSELGKLNLGGYAIKVSRDVRHAISGTRVDVDQQNGGLHQDQHSKTLFHNHSHHHDHGSASSTDQHHDHDHTHDHRHDHEHTHDHPHTPEHHGGHEQGHEHSHDHEGEPHHTHDHVHRNLQDIRQIVESSSLSRPVKERSMRMFRYIAEAEAKVHGTTVDRIHFHEVGAVDSIVDIVGAAICLDYLKVDKIISSPVELGGGFVKCAHGTMPVPAPATIEILRDIPVTTGRVDKETTTPTGAAILAANVDEFTSRSQLQVEKVGYGTGHRELAIPNILRVYLGTIEQEQGPAGYKRRQAVELTCNVDDMNPEHYDHIMERLFEAGADEVYITPVLMKKSRPASHLTVLADPGKQDAISRILFRETTTLGLRVVHMEKAELERRLITRGTRYGDVRVKVAYLDNQEIRQKPEYEDCKRIAREKGLSIQQVCKHIEYDMNKE